MAQETVKEVKSQEQSVVDLEDEAGFENEELLQKSNEERSVLLSSLKEELIQISELSQLEKAKTAEVVSGLRSLIKPFNTTIHMSPVALNIKDDTVSEVVLTAEGIVCLILENGDVMTKRFEQIPSETLLKIIFVLLPQIRSIIAKKKQNAALRASWMQKLALEMKRTTAQLMQ